MVEDKKKVVIIGTGFVGSTLAYTLINRTTINELVLLDVDRDKAEGEVLDLNHSISFLGPISIRVGDYSDCKGADVIVIAAGPSIQPGGTRLDLAKGNWEVTRSILDNIQKYSTDAVLLLITNPVDVLTYFAANYSDFPPNRVIGSGTVLDSSRFRYLLSRKYKVDVRNIHGYIIGEHGDSEVPAWSLTNISGTRIEEFSRTVGLELTEEVKENVLNEVMRAGYIVLEKKGATYYGVSMATCRIIEAIINNENSVLTVSSLLKGQYGIEDVCLSVPTIVNREGVSRVLELPLEEREIEKLRDSARKLKEVIKNVKTS